ncbi:MAG: tyrosine--tRNA ligase [Deltaproteobacteria bacterium]|nr:tyrosine--tRNA ligase [Deltaproteobacteria bacterium]
MSDLENMMNQLLRGVVDIVTKEELYRRLEESIKNDRPLIIKAGFDPTAPDLHLGHTIVLQKMRQFQELGHKVVFVIGDFTAMIGDPTGKNVTRPPLSYEQVMESAKTYTEQVYKILDRGKTEVRFNSEWLSKLGTDGIVRLAAKYSVARMLERDDFKKRYTSGISISIHEFLYPLLQAYDSVALRCDVELGGSDQLFNLLLGREIQREYGQSEQIVMTMPLLEGLDARLVDGKLVGNKMSKSLGNYVGINEPPDMMFGKLMSINDELMWRYYELLSNMSIDEIKRIRSDCESGRMNPMDAKKSLAKEIVARFHSSQDAENALRNFTEVFSKRNPPEKMDEYNIRAEDDGQIWVCRALASIKVVKSTSDAKRLINQGGLYINSERVVDSNLSLKIGSYIVKLGKKVYFRLNII